MISAKIIMNYELNSGVIILSGVKLLNLAYLAKSSGFTGFGYAASTSSKTFSGVNGTISNDESSDDTVYVVVLYYNISY